MNQSAKLKMAILILLSLGACSSKKPQPPDETVASDEQILETIEELPAGAEASGLLTFFPGEDRGIVIKGVRWGQAVSSENPGADCALAPAGDHYECVVKKGTEMVTVNVRERSGGVYRVSIQGKGSTTRDRWINQLGINGYRRQGQRAKDGSTRYYYSSGAKESRAELIWNPSTDAVIVSLGPPPR